MPLKAGVVQLSPTYGQIEANLDRIESLVELGIRQGAELLVLPEMAWTGYLWPDTQTLSPHAEEFGAGPGQSRMASLARRLSVTLVFGFPERYGNRFYNSQAIARPDASSQPVYRKSHLFEADEWWALPGDTGYRQWESPWGKIGSGICMDLNYADLAAFHGEAGTDLLAFSTNWLDQEFDVIPYWLDRLEGEEGRGYRGPALFANRGGEEFGIRFRGQSSIFDQGVCVASLADKEDGVLVYEFPTLSPR